jgi:hypothetical protein
MYINVIEQKTSLKHLIWVFVLKWRRTEILLIVLNLSLHFYNIYVHILLSAKTFFNTSYNVFNVQHHFDCQFWSLVCEPIFWFVNLFFGLLTYFLVCEPIFKESVITCTIPDKTKITKIEYRYRYYLNVHKCYRNVGRDLRLSTGFLYVVILAQKPKLNA